MDPRGNNKRRGMTDAELRERLDRLSLYVANLPEDRQALVTEEVLKVAPRKKTEDTEIVGVRMSKELIAEIDVHVERMKARSPGVNISRSDAIRSLLSVAISLSKPSERMTEDDMLMSQAMVVVRERMNAEGRTGALLEQEVKAALEEITKKKSYGTWSPPAPYGVKKKE